MVRWSIGFFQVTTRQWNSVSVSHKSVPPVFHLGAKILLLMISMTSADENIYNDVNDNVFRNVCEDASSNVFHNVHASVYNNVHEDIDDNVFYNIKRCQRQCLSSVRMSTTISFTMLVTISMRMSIIMLMNMSRLCQ